MSCVALIGLMGSGKSTVGALLAATSGAALVDVDRVIEARTGRTVRELWEEGGEVAYRRLESEVCLDAIAGGDGEAGEAGEDVVLAAPGGVVLDAGVRQALGTCTVIWLRAQPSTLAARVQVGDHRPLLGADPATVLAAMSTDRAAVYSELADLTIDVDRMTAEDVAAAILEQLDPADTPTAADEPDTADPTATANPAT